MSDASNRTLAWRDQKRREGYQPVTIWVPGHIKNAMVNLAFERHQDLGQLITDAFQAWTPARGVQAAVPMDMPRLKALIATEIAEALASQSPVPPPPAPPKPTPPPGTKQCRHGHAPYAASTKECPQCVRGRQKAPRQRKAATRRGEMPA